MEGIKITHGNTETEALAQQLFHIEYAVNKEGYMRCHISLNSIGLNEVEPRTGKGSLD